MVVTIKRYGLIAVFLATALAALVWRLNQVPPAPKADELLPSSTVFFLQCPDFDRLRVELPKTAAYALWREPQVQTFVQSLQRAFLDSLGAPKQQQRIGLPSFLETARGEVFFAVTDLSVPSRFGQKAVLGVDVQQNLLVTRLGLFYREFRMRAWNPKARFYTQQRHGIRYRVWELTPRFRVYHAFLNSLLVYSLDEETLCALLDRFTGNVPKNFIPLRGAAEYQDAVRHLRPAPVLAVYVNPTLFPKTWGLSRWLSRADAIALGTTFLDGQVRDLLYCAYFTPQTPPPPLARLQTIVLTTPQTVFYHAASADWETGYREWAEWLRQSENPHLAEFPSRFEQALRRNDIRLLDDLFRFLGPETALLATWRQGARLPDLALVVALQPADPLRLRLDVAMTALKNAAFPSEPSLPWDVTSFHGETLYTLRLSTTSIAPTYFTTDRYLVIASSPDHARELIHQLKQLVPTLAMNPNYQHAMKRLPSRFSTTLYCDLRSIVPALWALDQTSLRIAPTPWVRPDKLPRAEVLTRHLSTVASTTLAETHGKTTVTISSLGQPLTLCLGALAVYLAARPYCQTNPIAATTSSSREPPPLSLENPTESSQTPSP